MLLHSRTLGFLMQCWLPVLQTVPLIAGLGVHLTAIRQRLRLLAETTRIPDDAPAPWGTAARNNPVTETKALLLLHHSA